MIWDLSAFRIQTLVFTSPSTGASAELGVEVSVATSITLANQLNYGGFEYHSSYLAIQEAI